MSNNLNLAEFGPLAGLLGEWEGTKGTDVSPGKPDKMETDIENNFLEHWSVKPVTPYVENHDQKLRQVICNIDAWRGKPSTAGKVAGEKFHGELGFMVWDPASGMIVNSFAVPRGIVINAGGKVKPDATEFELVAEAGSESFGICQNPFLLEQFKVVRFIRKIKLNGDGSLDYEQDTQLEIKGRGLMHHTDANHVKRLS